MMNFWQMVPLAAVITVVIQTAFVLLWVGRAGARLDMLEQRIEQQAGVAERLARWKNRRSHSAPRSTGSKPS